ncbi:MAG TPA: aldehyde dehydrogenase family protein [Candidatus Baltobacteraceae bacterium]|jgi:NADP-dependent aldehyde dehydrogenase|nr:aldehyde dehydrogenase family protein [Candidatus Baltobacteraceae bacterium]
MTTNPVLIAGQWRAAKSGGTFHAENPATGETLPDEFPVSAWADCDAALSAAAQAAIELRSAPPEHIAGFLQRFAERIETRAVELVDRAHLETALPQSPRLAQVELPRTTGQLRQAAAAAAVGSWAMPTIDSKLNIRSMLAPLGPVWVFGPNNFPLAFNSIAGGDFAAAIAAGNPVIAKANSSHPGTTRLLAEEAFAAVTETGLPPATVQLIFRTSHADGERLAADARTAALAYTGSRAAGLKLKAAADRAGKLSYMELSSVNPLLMLPGALAERGAKLVEDFCGSCLLASGQFCTCPSLVLLFAGEATELFVAAVRQEFEATPPTSLLSSGVLRSLEESVRTLLAAGAELVTGGSPLPMPGYRFANTLLRVSGEQFLAAPEKLQTEAFGNASLFVVMRDAGEASAVLDHLEGNLTGGVYSDTSGADDALYAKLAPLLRARVGRLLNDKMPTGVAVTGAMNHGGPFPATGHPGFTAVGIPASLRRFAMLQCFDNVRPHRLPPALGDHNPNGKMWRLIDGQWTQGSIPG